MIIGGVVLLCAFARSEIAPRLEMDSSFCDLETNQEQVVSGLFRLKNTGWRPLEFASKGCGCAVTRLRTNKLAHGQTATLEFEVDLGGDTFGPVTKVIKLGTSDPEGRAVELPVKVFSAARHALSPRHLVVSLPGSVDRHADFLRLDGPPLGPLEIKAPTNCVAAYGLGTNGASAIIHVRALGPGSGRIEVRAAGEPWRSIELVVFERPPRPTLETLSSRRS